jgi:thiamine-phosphate pyrophosphorylase
MNSSSQPGRSAAPLQRAGDGWDAAHLLLHVLTDRAAAAGRSEEEIAAAALSGGATVVQLRGKDLTGVDVALAVDADGAHIGQDDLPAEDGRRLLGPSRLLGVSARTVDEAVRAAHSGADYIGFGPVFSTPSKSDAGAPSGLAALRRAVLTCGVPVVAIGGITAANAPAVIDAGAAGVAVIAAIVGAPDVEAAARTLRRALLPLDPGHATVPPHSP